MANARQLFERLSDVGLDIVTFWPYDEGGCACEKCKPWGSNGYLSSRVTCAARPESLSKLEDGAQYLDVRYAARRRVARADRGPGQTRDG